MLFVLPGFLVYLYSGASVFTAAQKSHPLMRTFVMCFSNGCQNPNNIYWKPSQRQIHGEIHGQGVDGRPDCEFWWRKTSGTFWQQAIAEKNTALALFVYCSGVLFFSLTFSIVSCTMSLLPLEYFGPGRVFPICCQKFPLTANLTIVEKVHQIIPIRNIFVPRLSI